MHYIKAKLIAVLLLGAGLTGLQAQEVLPATGGNASGGGGTVSYTVGQVIYTTNTGTNGSVAQGVQQPYEIFVVIGLPEVIGINLVVSAYPNPTTDNLILKTDASVLHIIQSMYYQLFDVNGKLLESNKIESNETRIVVSSYTHATYFLKVIQGDKEVKTFKITKN